MHAELYDRPDLYDLVAPADAAMERFYIDKSRQLGGTVLELACGSGRFTVPLAKAGLEVAGLDLSAAMLVRARVAADAAGVTPELHQGDMRHFQLGRHFDAIVVAANSLLHLHTAEDFHGFFGCIGKHLKPGGALLFDVFVPSLRLLTLNPDERDLLGRFPHPELGEVTVEETIRYDTISQVSQADWYWSTEAERDFWHTRLELRQIFPQELVALVTAGGLQLAERYGDFLGSPLSHDSRRQVCVCRLP